MLQIKTIPYWRDNYCYFLQSSKNGVTALIDCGDATPVIDFFLRRKCSLNLILVTHHHYDHTDGLGELMEYFPKAKLFKPRNEPRIQHGGIEVDENSVVTFENDTFKVISLSAHTSRSICFEIKGNYFVGDSLFSAGCGRLFEGDGGDLERVMDKILGFPKASKIYFGHEYTQSNLNFAHSMEPNNVDILSSMMKINGEKDGNIITTPTTVLQEMKINPFLRIDAPELIQNIDSSLRMTRAERMGNLRKMKDCFV